MLRQSFKTHLTFYLLVNVLLIGVWAASGGGYFWPVWPILGWGIAVAAHGSPLVGGSGWRPSQPTPGSEATAPHVRDAPTSVHQMASSV